MLLRLPSGYHFRRHIPSHLRDVLGKREVWHSLGTTKRDMAKTYVCEIYVSTEKLSFSATRLMDELKETKDFIKNELPDEMWEVFEFLIKDYQDQIKILKTKYERQELRHAKPSPLFSKATETFLETKTNVKQSVIDSYRATSKSSLKSVKTSPYASIQAKTQDFLNH